MIDVSRFKVVYNERVLIALAVGEFDFPEHTHKNDTLKKPSIIEVVAINEDGNIVIFRDEAWRFQFIPKISKGE